MKKIVYTLLIVILAAGSFMAGNRSHNPEKEQANSFAKAETRQVLYYVDPMNPGHTSDKPGMAPCGMPMEPVYADQHHNVAGRLPPGAARITAEKRQIMGVRVAPVAVNSYQHKLRTLGTVAPNENLTYRVTAGDKGWVWNVHQSTTGSLVQKDQLMATVYNYDFLTRQQQYLYALEFEERRKKKLEQRIAKKIPDASSLPTSSHGQDKSGNKHQPNDFLAQLTSYSKVPSTVGGHNPSGSVVFSIRDQLEVARLELFSIGVSDYQIDEITRKRSIANDIEIRSPADGIVISRNVSPQQRFNKGEELFVVADLRQVWILADLYEQEAHYIRPGMRARVSLPKHGQVLEATVSTVPPTFDDRSHTLKVQLDVENPEFKLRPDMFVDVEFLIDFEPAITVPADAVIDSGLRKTVFVDQGDGYFIPRQVQTGWRFGDKVEITAGLKPDEHIAVSGNFFIDSESRMKMAAGNLIAGHNHGGHANHNMEYKDKHADLSDHHPMVQKTGHHPSSDNPGITPNPAGLSGGSAIDPICGMSVTPHHAEGAGWVSHGDGGTHYFCSESCKTRYDDSHGKPANIRETSQQHVQHNQQTQEEKISTLENMNRGGRQVDQSIAPAAHKKHGGLAHD